MSHFLSYFIFLQLCSSWLLFVVEHKAERMLLSTVLASGTFWMTLVRWETLTKWFLLSSTVCSTSHNLSCWWFWRNLMSEIDLNWLQNYSRNPDYSQTTIEMTQNSDFSTVMLNHWLKLSLSLLVKVPAVVQESHVFGPVEAAIQSCFNGVCSIYTHSWTNTDTSRGSLSFWLYLGYEWEGRGGAFCELAAIGSLFAAVALHPLQTRS